MNHRRRAIILSPIALLGAQKHSYRLERRYVVSPKSVDIEIINGTVKVRAGNRKEIKVLAAIELTAPTPEDLELAKAEVKFDPRLEGESFRVWVETREQRRWNRYSYRHDVELEIPANSRLILRGVNGNVEVSFDAPPVSDIYVKTVNGEINLELPRPIHADFQMKTFQGNIYSAFEMTPLPDSAETSVTEQGMRRIVHRNRFAGGRMGRGGIVIKIETTNGDIRIAERKA
jgi:hypothetical protein